MYLGIEIGGTKLQLGIGPGDSTLKARWRGSVDVARGADGIRAQITSAVPELLSEAGLAIRELKGIGIGFGGPVDDATRTVIKSHQIQGWDDFPLADWITDLVGLPAVLGNDADVAGLAEALFGAGKGLSPIFYITIGSGIGGGLIINGEIYRGCGRGAAEIGHLRMDEGDNIVENAASGWGIEQTIRRAARRNPDAFPLLLREAHGDPEQITTKLIGEVIAEEGYRAADAILEMPRVHLANAICHVIALLGPRRIVIGGGVSLLGEEALFRPLRCLVAERVFAPFRDCYDIVPAALGEEVVVHGALALARKRLS